MTRRLYTLALIVTFLGTLFAFDDAKCDERGAKTGENAAHDWGFSQKIQKKDSWLGEDKIQHFFAAAFVTGSAFLLMREPLDSSENNSLYFGSGVSLGLGIGKEIYDWKSEKGQASYKDLGADILGIGFAVVLIKIISH